MSNSIEKDCNIILSFLADLTEYRLSNDEWDRILKLDLDDDEIFFNLLTEKCFHYTQTAPSFVVDAVRLALNNAINCDDDSYLKCLELVVMPFDGEDVGTSFRFFSLMHKALFDDDFKT